MSLLLLTALLLSKSDDGKGVYEAWQKKLRDAKTISGTMLTGPRQEPKKTMFRLMKPFYQEILGPETEQHSDGKHSFLYQIEKKEYFLSQGDLGGAIGGNLLAMEPFGSNKLPMIYQSEEVVTFDDQEVYAVNVKPSSKISIARDLRATYYFSKRSGMLVGFRQMIGNDMLSGRYANLVFDVPMEPSSFTWTVPAGAKPYSGGDRR